MSKKFTYDDFRKELLRQKAQYISSVLDDDRRTDHQIAFAALDEIFLLEQILKTKIAEENFLLLYEKIPRDSELTSALENEPSATQRTLNLGDSLKVFRVIFPDSEITKNTQSIELLVDQRNELRHHVAHFIMNMKELLELIRKVYEVQLAVLESIVGKVPVAKKSALSTAEIAQLFEDSVRKKIRPRPSDLMFSPSAVAAPIYDFSSSAISGGVTANVMSGFAYSAENCPRCGTYSFRRKHENIFTISVDQDNSYICSFCGLELTEEERKVAKNLKR